MPVPEHEGFLFGFQAGVGWAYEDEVHMMISTLVFTLKYSFKNNYFVQLAPKYSWLMKWNEHYLTLPIHIGKRVGNRLSFFAGPALTYDIAFFRDLGLSAGACYHFGNRSALVLSLFTFTLYDYDIDYLIVPVSISYSFTL